MKTITIRRIEETNGFWFNYEVECLGNVLRHLTWDEMLGSFCRIILCNAAPTNVGQRDPSDVVRYELVITVVDAANIVIENGDRFCGRLNFDEALGFIALFTRSGETIFGGFRTYTQWLADPIHKSWGKVPIVGMLPAPVTL